MENKRNRTAYMNERAKRLSAEDPVFAEKHKGYKRKSTSKYFAQGCEEISDVYILGQLSSQMGIPVAELRAMGNIAELIAVKREVLKLKRATRNKN